MADDVTLDSVLRGLTSAIGKLTSGLAAVRTQLVAMGEVSKARHEEHVRVTTDAAKAARAQAAAVRAALRAMGQRDDDTGEDIVGDEVKALQVKALQKAGGWLDVPGAVWAWLAADKIRTIGILTALAGFLADLSTGAGVASALIQTLTRISTGSAP